MSILDRTRVSGAILHCCKMLIEIIGPPKPDRHITTTIEILETADVSEYMRYGDKDSEVEETGQESITTSQQPRSSGLGELP